MPTIIQVKLRRKGAWALLEPDSGDGITLPVSAIPAWAREGATVGQPEWDSLVTESRYHNLYLSALRILGRREHFERELRRKLAARQQDRQIIQRVVDKCLDAGYLNDERAANQLVQALISKGGIGRPRVYGELMRRGCSKQLADSIIEGLAGRLDPAQETERVLEKRRKRIISKANSLIKKHQLNPRDVPRDKVVLARHLFGALAPLLAGKGLLGDESRDVARRIIHALIDEL